MSPGLLFWSVIAGVVTVAVSTALLVAARNERRARRVPAAAIARHPSRVPGLPRDGRRLDGYEQARLNEIEWDSTWINVPEPRTPRNGS